MFRLFFFKKKEKTYGQYSVLYALDIILPRP